MAYFIIKNTDNTTVDCFVGDIDTYLEQESKLENGWNIMEVTEADYIRSEEILNKLDEQINLDNIVTINSLSTFDKKYSLISMLTSKGDNPPMAYIKDMWKFVNEEDDTVVVNNKK